MSVYEEAWASLTFLFLFSLSVVVGVLDGDLAGDLAIGLGYRDSLRALEGLG